MFDRQQMLFAKTSTPPQPGSIVRDVLYMYPGPRTGGVETCVSDNAGNATMPSAYATTAHVKDMSMSMRSHNIYLAPRVLVGLLDQRLLGVCGLAKRYGCVGVIQLYDISSILTGVMPSEEETSGLMACGIRIGLVYIHPNTTQPSPDDVVNAIRSVYATCPYLARTVSDVVIKSQCVTSMSATDAQKLVSSIKMYGPSTVVLDHPPSITIAGGWFDVVMNGDKYMTGCGVVASTPDTIQSVLAVTRNNRHVYLNDTTQGLVSNLDTLLRVITSDMLSVVLTPTVTKPSVVTVGSLFLNLSVALDMPSSYVGGDTQITLMYKESDNIHDQQWSVTTPVHCLQGEYTYTVPIFNLAPYTNYAIKSVLTDVVTSVVLHASPTVVVCTNDSVVDHDSEFSLSGSEFNTTNLITDGVDIVNNHGVITRNGGSVRTVTVEQQPNQPDFIAVRPTYTFTPDAYTPITQMPDNVLRMDLNGHVLYGGDQVYLEYPTGMDLNTVVGEDHRGSVGHLHWSALSTDVQRMVYRVPGVCCIATSSKVYTIGNYDMPGTVIQSAAKDANGNISQFVMESLGLSFMPVKSRVAMVNRTASYVYVFGGEAITYISRAPIDAFGQLGAFQILDTGLPIAMRGGNVCEIGDKMYLFGGPDTNDIYAADIYNDGTIGNFIATAASLPSVFVGGSLIKTSTKLYFVGYDTTEIMSASIVGGVLGAVTVETTATLPIKLQYTSPVVTDTYVLLIGGMVTPDPSGTAQEPTTDIMVASIDRDGNMSGFVLQSPGDNTLNALKTNNNVMGYSPTIYQSNDKLYVLSDNLYVSGFSPLTDTVTDIKLVKPLNGMPTAAYNANQTYFGYLGYDHTVKPTAVYPHTVSSNGGVLTVRCNAVTAPGRVLAVGFTGNVGDVIDGVSVEVWED